MRYIVWSPYITAVVDETSQVALFGGIDDQIIIDSEHVATAYAHTFVSLFSRIGDLLANDLNKMNVFL